MFPANFMLLFSKISGFGSAIFLAPFSIGYNNRLTSLLEHILANARTYLVQPVCGQTNSKQLILIIKLVKINI